MCTECQNRFLQVMTEEEYDAIYGDYEADAEVLSAQQVTRNINEYFWLRLELKEWQSLSVLLSWS